MARKQVKRKKLNRKQAERKRAERKQVEQQLRELDAMRQAVQSMDQTVQTMDEALQVLTPEERLIVQMLYICPEKNAVQKLCPMLCVEQAAVYRRKNKALKKLTEALRIEN